jgi:NIMA (never in mitosis gene a)-related kinase
MESEVHICVVEDDKYQRLRLEDIVTLLEYRVTTAVDGQDAWDKLQDPNLDVTLILLDLMMPNVDGFELLKRLKDHPRLKDIPVIMMSSTEDMEMVASCLEKGAFDFLIKPIRPGVLRGLINQARCSQIQVTPDVELSGIKAYEKISNLGDGGFGHVDLVKKKATGQLFALKRIDMQLLNDRERKNAENEATLLKVLVGPTIIRYYEQIFADNQLVIVMEYAQGGNLAVKLKDMKNAGQRLSTLQTLTWLAHLVIALMLMHSKNILHRDLKTQNLFLSEDNIIKVGDFGISKALGNSIEMAKSSVGTPYFMSPELCKGESYGTKTDIWALGCVLYEMITYKKPFDDKEIGGLTEKIMNRDPDPLPPDTDLNLQTLCVTMLRKDPARRPTAWELANNPELKPIIIQFIESQNCSDTIMPLFELDPRLKRTGVEEKKATDRMEAAEVARMVQPSIPLTDLSGGWLGKSYKRVFLGQSLLEALQRSLKFPPNQATEMSQDMLDQGVIHSIDSNAVFAARKHYQFQEDRSDIARNMIHLWSKEVRVAHDVAADLVRFMNNLLSTYNYQSTRIRESEMYRQLLRVGGELQRIEVKAISKPERFLFFLNIYQVMLAHQLLEVSESERSGWFSKPSDAFYYNIAGQNFTLRELKHGVLRGNRKPPDAYTRVFSANDPRCYLPNTNDPRVLIVCSDPPVPLGPLLDFSAGLEAVLDAQAEEYCNREVCLNTSTGELTLPRLFETYYYDFGNSDRELLEWVWRYFRACRVPLQEVLEELQNKNLFLHYRD